MQKKETSFKPLDHPLLSIFSALYRVESGAWYAAISDWARSVLHPAVIGAIPGQEALDIAWDIQAFLERAAMLNEDAAVSSYDYAKYFDSFDHQWTKNSCLSLEWTRSWSISEEGSLNGLSGTTTSEFSTIGSRKEASAWGGPI